jgi:hypothetical protein
MFLVLNSSEFYRNLNAVEFKSLNYESCNRSCPECRVKSDFVTPSKFWVDVKEDKEKLIDEYKQALRYGFPSAF